MSASVSDCYPELVDAFENGSTHTTPDTLCAKYFYTTFPNQKRKPKQCLAHMNHKNSDINRIYQDYDSMTGVLTLTTSHHHTKQHSVQVDKLPHVDVIVQPQITRHEMAKNVRLRFQSPNNLLGTQKSDNNNNNNNECISLDGQNDMTLTLPSPSAKLGHQITSGDFNGNGELDMAISAPYDGQTGTVFILNNSTMKKNKIDTTDIRKASSQSLHGKLKHGRFGWSMTAIDMNQDGIDDLAISTPFSDDDSGGIVEIYFGQEKFGLADNPNIQIQLQSQALLGTALAGIDVDQDGFKDLVIGCPLCTVGNQPQVK